MDIQIRCSGITFVFLALLCLILPIDWIAAAVTAGAVHELCHILAIRLIGGRIYELRIGQGSAVMETAFQTPKQELICALAGPVGSFSLLILSEFIPKISFCGMLQGIYNLLPFYPLDGGRILHCGLRLYYPVETVNKIYCFVQWCTYFLFISFGIWVSIRYKSQCIILFVLLFLFQKIQDGKIPCKERQQRVQ